MKSILSASVCAAMLSLAVPAMAADETAKPMHHHMHHMGKKSSMMGPHTKMKKAGDPTTDELNAKSLDAAKGGSSDAGAAAPAAAPSTMSPPAAGTSSMSAPSTGTTAPMNAPAGTAPGAPGGN